MAYAWGDEVVQQQRSHRARLRDRNRGKAALLLFGVCALAAASSCSADTGDSSAKATGASPSLTRSADQDAVEKNAVLASYRLMWEARNRTYATAKLDPDLEKYAGNKALSNIKLTMLYHQEHGTVMEGEPVNSPEVTAIDATKATLKDCVDTSKYTEVESKTGKTVSNGDGPRRHVYNASAIKTGGKWIIWTTAIDRGRTC